MVVGALVGAALAQMLGAGNQSASLLLGQMRARQAARSGLEWARYRAERLGICASGTLNFSEAALTGFRASVSCTRTTHADATTVRVVYALQAFSQYGSFGQADYVSYRDRLTLVR